MTDNTNNFNYENEIELDVLNKNAANKSRSKTKSKSRSKSGGNNYSSSSSELSLSNQYGNIFDNPQKYKKSNKSMRNKSMSNKKSRKQSMRLSSRPDQVIKGWSAKYMEGLTKQDFDNYMVGFESRINKQLKNIESSLLVQNAPQMNINELKSIENIQKSQIASMPSSFSPSLRKSKSMMANSMSNQVSPVVGIDNLFEENEDVPNPNNMMMEGPLCGPGKKCPRGYKCKNGVCVPK
jgi:hypothetical protein